MSLRERLQNPTSTQLPLICSPNLDLLSRDLGPTVRDSVFVTGHFWMCMIFSEIVRGWVKRSSEGDFRPHTPGREGPHPGFVRLPAHCFFSEFAFVLFCRTKGKPWVWIDAPAARRWQGRAADGQTSGDHACFNLGLFWQGSRPHPRLKR